MQNVTTESHQRDRVVALDAYRPPFRQVPIEALDASWPQIEKGLLAILAECPKEHWTPRDIRRYLRAGRATAFVRPDGFVILERSEEPVSGEPFLNAWLMWMEAGTLPRDEVAAWLDDMARSRHLEWWQLSSPRLGWGRYLAGVCEVAYVTYRRYV